MADKEVQVDINIFRNVPSSVFLHLIAVKYVYVWNEVDEDNVHFLYS